MDFGFVGPAYESTDYLQQAQRLINWYPETSQVGRGKGDVTGATPVNPGSVIALLGCPGLKTLQTTIFGQVRGAWTLPGNTQALWVIGNSVYLMTISTPATSTAVATFTMSSVGSLLTYTGPVCIRDNGAGGIAVIVDGVNGYVYNIASHVVTQITDAAWLPADRVAFIDGWLVFNKTNSQIFFTSPIYWNGVTAMNATYYALKDSSSDNLVTLYENNRELWLIGERCTEVWYDAGGTNFPFSRLPGATVQIGCSAKHSIARLGNNLIWLGRSERGENVVVMNDGYQVTPISNHAVNHAISSYTIVSDAIGYVYFEEGHEFYVLTFPSADVTWVYDASTQMWHQRASFDPVLGVFHRHRSNCCINFANQRLVGDYQNGNIYSMSRSVYSDGVYPLVCVRRTPHVWDDRKRVFYKQIQIEFIPGVGLQSGQGSNPMAMLRWSKDGSKTWSNEYKLPIGSAGNTRYRCIKRRMGWAWDMVFEVTFSDPVPRDIVGATLLVEESDI